MKYSVKVVYTYLIGDSDKRFYEEQILLICAEDFDKAFEKAEKYASEYADEHINPDGEIVKTEKVDILSCFSVFDDEEDGVIEVYSSITKNRTTLSESDFYDAFTSEQCEVDEMTDLRNEKYN